MSIVPRMLSAVGAVVGATAPSLATDITRSDFRVRTIDGVGIQVREIRPADSPAGAPLILVHGARVPGLASFDLEVPGGSFAADLARRLGRPVLVMDARGYGGSDRPAAMSRPAHDSRPLSRAYEVVRDIDAVVQAARRRAGTDAVALLGWATGGMWCAYYASLWPDNVSHLVTLNALYGGSAEHATLRSAPTAGYALYDLASLFPGWDRSIPAADRASWRDPAVADAYGKAALASDPTATTRDPPTFRAPLGALEDSFYQAGGRRLFDAGSITAATLVVRSELDFWSRPEDSEAFVRDATHARTVKLLALPQATHFVHLERSERGRAALIDAVAALLGGER